MIIRKQKEFNAHKRNAKRRAATKEQNEIMHANSAEKKVKRTEKAVKKGTESAKVIDAQLNNANRLAKGTPVQEKVAKKVEEVAKESTALKTTVRRGAKKAEKFVKNHPGAVALGATGLAAAGVVGGMVAKKNKEEKRKVFSVAKNENGEEKMFSVTEKHFSKMEDEDYIEKKRIKRNQ